MKTFHCTTPRFDLRKQKKKPYFVAPKYKASALCSKCSWRGWRTVIFYVDSNRLGKVPLLERDRAVKGAKTDCCPRCGGDCFFTHTSGRNRR